MRGAYLLAELAIGSILLGCAALAGLALVHRPWPNRLDVAGFALLPADPSSKLYNHIALAGSPRVLVVGVVVAALACVWHDRARALSCLLGPAVAVAKPIVSRHVTAVGGNSYPSGTVTAVTALALVLVLAAPRFARPILAFPAVCAVAAVCAAVVALRWHYPTDALGGICVGGGAVFVSDGLAHLPGFARAGREPVHAARSVPAPMSRGSAAQPASRGSAPALVRSAIDPRVIDPHVVDPRFVDAQPADPGSVDPQPVDPQPVDPQPVDPQPVDPRPVVR
jgi:membrane-associated phospholipid phosphatase